MPTQCWRFKSCVRPSYSMIILVVNHACIDRPPFLFIDRLARLHQASQRIDACSSPSLVDSSLQFQPRCLAGGWVNEQLCFSIFLISGAPVAAILIQQWLGRLHSFFSSGWLVRNLRAQGAKIWLQQRRSTCRWLGVLPRREGAQVRATPSAGVFIFNPYTHLGCLAASDHAVRPS